MKVYLSARYGRMAELVVYAAQLADLGIECTSRWLTGSTVDATAENARIDVDDVYAADVFVTFSEEPVEFSPLSYASRGGRHVEFGIAYEAGTPCIVVGPRENVFHLLGEVEQYDAWPEALDRLQELGLDEARDRLIARERQPVPRGRLRRRAA